MNGQPIPGFYYDTEKKKYFKIQTAGAARHLDLRYSAENIRKKEKSERLQHDTTTRIDKIRRERVVCRYASNLTQTCAERELGVKRRSFYMQHRWPEACMFGVTATPTKVLDRPSDASIRCFDRDPVTKTIYAVHGDNRVKRRRLYTRNGPPLPLHDTSNTDHPFTPYSFEPWDEVARTTSTVSSLCYLPTTGALAITTHGSDAPPVIQLSDPDRDGPYISQQFTPKACRGISACAARPASSLPSPTSSTIPASHAEHLAVAASKSLLLFTRSPTGVWDSHVALHDLPADLLALAWISHSTLALGARDGSVRLHDSRSRGTSTILVHPGPAACLHVADDPTRLVCAGLGGTMALYDIRAARATCLSSSTSSTSTSSGTSFAASSSTRPRKRNRKGYFASQQTSTPLLRFTHDNPDDLELGMDVHARLGLVAAAQEGGDGVAVRVSSLWTGGVVREFRCAGGGGGGRDGGWAGGGGERVSGKERIRTLKFIDAAEPDGGVELWTGWQGGVARFAW